MNIFHYLFYFIYSNIIKYRNRKDSVFYSSLILSIFQVFFVFDILYVIERLTGFYYSLNELEAIILYWIINGIDCLYFYRKDRFKKINNKYRTQDEKLKRQRDILTILLVIIIFVSFFTLASIRVD